MIRSITKIDKQMMDTDTQQESDKEWQSFLNKINDYANDPFDKWTHYTLLSYFLVKYKEFNGVDFIFSFSKRGPTKSKEMKNASKILHMCD